MNINIKALVLLLVPVLLTSCEVAKVGKPQQENLIHADTFYVVSQDSTTTTSYLDQNPKVIFLKEPVRSNWFKDILPILTLLLGILINRGIEYATNRIKLKRVGKRWTAELRNLEVPLQAQIKNLKDFITELSQSKDSLPELTLLRSLRCDNFNYLDKGDLMSYLEKKYSKETHLEIVKINNRITGKVSLLMNLHDSMYDRYKLFIDRTSKLYEELNLNMNVLGREIADYGTQLELRLGKDPYMGSSTFKHLWDIWSTKVLAQKDGKFDLNELHDNVFLEYLKALSQVRTDKDIKSLVLYTSNCLQNIKAINAEKVYLKEVLSKVIERYEIHQQELPALIESLEKS